MIPAGALLEIRQVFERCQRNYPTIQQDLDVFAAHVEQIMHRMPEAEGAASFQGDCNAWLVGFSRLHHMDLYLALACSRGDRIAWEYFADDYLPLVQRFALQVCRNSTEGEDLAQELVVNLLPAPGREAKLASYNGRGSLAGWLRVAVAHAAIDRFRRSRRQVSLDELEEQNRERPAHFQRASENGVEERLDSHWGPVLSKLLCEELQRLQPRDRLLLSLYYVQGVPLREIGRQFGVHEATASRWLEHLRRGIRKRVEREIKRHHGLGSRDLQSLWRWVSEEEGLALEKLLADAGDR